MVVEGQGASAPAKPAFYPGGAPTATAKNPSRGHAIGMKPPAVAPIDKGLLAAHWATALYTALRGKLVYSETGARSQLYDRVKAGLARGWTQAQIIADLEKNPPDADCSQFVATCNMAAGFPKYNDRDYTGTELQEGTEVALADAKPGDDVIYGGGTGEHVDKIVEAAGTNSKIIGFGHPGAPDYGVLAGSIQWFATHGRPGIRVLRPA